MLPAGLSAQPAAPATLRALHASLPAARTVVRLLVGGCSCDLVRPRHPEPREDERHHRERARAGGERGPQPRAELIARLERHRLGARVPVPAGGWPRALAEFVAEHARNAGETLYLLRFAWSDEPGAPSGGPLDRIQVADVLARPAAWLAEDVAIVVGR